MRRKRLTFSALAVVAAGIVALVIAVSGGSASKVKPTSPSGAGVLSVRHTALGNMLVDGNGRTLYLFLADKPDRSTLSREGLAVWPAFTSALKPQAKGGVSAAHIATIEQADGQRQVTYYGHPLYYYVGDKASGETKGQGLKEFGALWYVVSKQGHAITAASPTTTPTEPAGAEPEYSY